MSPSIKRAINIENTKVHIKLLFQTSRLFQLSTVNPQLQISCQYLNSIIGCDLLRYLHLLPCVKTCDICFTDGPQPIVISARILKIGKRTTAQISCYPNGFFHFHLLSHPPKTMRCVSKSLLSGSRLSFY
jgi:hypothetical protein